MIALLEKVVDGKSGTVMLTELGIWAMDIPENVIAGFELPAMTPHNSPTVGAWDEPAMIQLEDFFWFGNNGPLMRMVDGPVASSNLEVPREMVWQNIRRIFESFGVRVYVFHDQVEIRGFIPTEVMDIPRRGDRIRGEAIIPSVRGLGDRVRAS
jgi:hypothetical protein